MFLLKFRRERESIILSEMIRMSCTKNHTMVSTLCEECQQLESYAVKRVLSCIYGEAKPVCKLCPTHCYSPKRREQMQKVMQYSGPRMLLYRPLFAITHFIDNFTATKSSRFKKEHHEKDIIKRSPKSTL